MLTERLGAIDLIATWTLESEPRIAPIVGPTIAPFTVYVPLGLRFFLKWKDNGRRENRADWIFWATHTPHILWKTFERKNPWTRQAITSFSSSQESSSYRRGFLLYSLSVQWANMGTTNQELPIEYVINFSSL